MADKPTAYLALYLDAPLQSWGYQSKFDRRTTLSYPTYSGIIGMICAAMGIDRSDTAKLAKLSQLDLTVYTFRMEGRLTDFHTVGGGWDKKSQPQNIVRTSKGDVGNTVVTRREYLQGARFGATISGPRRQIDEVAAALKNPRWGIWLGRKACIPASPVLQGTFDCRNDALGKLCRLSGVQPLRAVSKADTFAEGTDTLPDKPLDFKTRKFAPRRIAMKLIELE